MTDYHWPQIRDQATKAFGDTPSAQLEADILEHFTERPAYVTDLLQRIATKVGGGKVRSGWAVVRKELNTPTIDVTVTDEAERTKRIRNAHTWIDNAGLHYDRPDHVEADLFGDDYARGPLTPYDTPELRTELLAYWQHARPRGEQAERDHEAWNATAKANRQLLLSLQTKQHQTHIDQDIDFTPSDPPSYNPPASNPAISNPPEPENG